MLTLLLTSQMILLLWLTIPSIGTLLHTIPAMPPLLLMLLRAPVNSAPHSCPALSHRVSMMDLPLLLL